MRLRADQIEGQRELAPIYLISGDEPLQVGEAADTVRRRAREAGFATREVFEAGRGFDWGQLLAAGNMLSLFGDQRLFDLRLSGSPGRDGGEALRAYADALPQDVVLLITAPRFDAASQKSRWFTTLEKAGVTVVIYPPDAKDLPRWIDNRMRSRGLEPTREASALLAERVEGNLLAAAQEIDMLSLLHGSGQVDAETVLRVVTDSARYDVYDLVDAVLEGRVARVQRVINGLRGEGVATALVLWAVTREVRAMCAMAADVAAGRSLGQVFSANRVWQRRQPLVRAALGRDLAHWRRGLRGCARCDRVIKGQEAGNAWHELDVLVTTLSGLPRGA